MISHHGWHSFNHKCPNHTIHLPPHPPSFPTYNDFLHSNSINTYFFFPPPSLKQTPHLLTTTHLFPLLSSFINTHPLSPIPKTCTSSPSPLHNFLPLPNTLVLPYSPCSQLPKLAHPIITPSQMLTFPPPTLSLLLQVQQWSLVCTVGGWWKCGEVSSGGEGTADHSQIMHHECTW